MTDEVELVRALGNRFIQRKDVKAYMRDNGEWFPVRDQAGHDVPFTMNDFREHFAGTRTLGHYMVDTQGYCKLFAYDIDLVKHDRTCVDPSCKSCPVIIHGDDGQDYSGVPRQVWGPPGPVTPVLTRHLRCMAEGLALRVKRILNLPIAIATSGNKGLHVYAFTGTTPADVVRQAAIGILQDFAGAFEPFRGENFWRHISEYPTLDIEVFPKQGSLDGKEYGNLMKLPLGIHRVTGRRSEFITAKAGYDTLIPKDPMEVLSGDSPWD